MNISIPGIRDTKNGNMKFYEDEITLRKEKLKGNKGEIVVATICNYAHKNNVIRISPRLLDENSVIKYYYYDEKLKRAYIAKEDNRCDVQKFIWKKTGFAKTLEEIFNIYDKIKKEFKQEIDREIVCISGELDILYDIKKNILHARNDMIMVDRVVMKNFLKNRKTSKYVYKNNKNRIEILELDEKVKTIKSKYIFAETNDRFILILFQSIELSQKYTIPSNVKNEIIYIPLE